MPLPSDSLYPAAAGLYPAGVAEAEPGIAGTPFSTRGIQVLVEGRDLTNRVDNLVFSSVDNGGFEIATLGMPSTDRPVKGAAVMVRCGLEVAWAGRVAEIADHSAHAHATKTTGCEGLQAVLKDNPYSMIYVDRELAQWRSPGLRRAKKLVIENYPQGASTTGFDATTEAPAIIQQINGDWAAPNKPIVENWYDAGASNRIGLVHYTLTDADSAFSDSVFVTNDEEALEAVSSGGLSPSASGYLIPSSQQWRYALLQHAFTTTPGGNPDQAYLAYWQNLAVYGTHGLPGRGPDPVGFYPSDIVRHALGQTAGIQPGVIVDSTSYIAPHVVYRTPTSPDVVINDMAKLMGWSWGVWEPPGIFSTEPRLDFRPPPSDATAIVTKAECDELDITSRLGDLYDTAIVSYTGADGSLQQVTVKLPNAQLNEAGLAGRTLLLSAGLSSEAAARTLGGFELALSQLAARGAGQATLPAYVKLPGGGSKPAMLLRPGIDRLRIPDLISGGPLFDQGTTRRDIFRISRIETTIGRDGVASTRVELDQGLNLLETLQARLALQAGVVGSGASGGG